MHPNETITFWHTTLLDVTQEPLGAQLLQSRHCSLEAGVLFHRSFVCERRGKGVVDVSRIHCTHAERPALHDRIARVPLTCIAACHMCVTYIVDCHLVGDEVPALVEVVVVLGRPPHNGPVQDMVRTSLGALALACR